MKKFLSFSFALFVFRYISREYECLDGKYSGKYLDIKSEKFKVISHNEGICGLNTSQESEILRGY